MPTYLLALDQGTTSSRAILFDREQRIVGTAQKEFTQHYPREGWVEHDAMEIWSSQYSVMMEVLAQSGVDPADIAAIGITNQRETTILWDKETGRPIHNAIVWQCRRTAPMVDALLEQGLGEHIRRTTGLVPDAYFSATKIKWLLDHVEGARALADQGRLLFGTVDTWLLWKLTGGAVHVTDYTNASRTMLYDIRRLCWDETLLQALDIPRSILPEVRDSSAIYGYTDLQGVRVPIAGIAGDQQAALFGQGCFSPGEAKNTYGTGCFLLMNTGETPCESSNGLITTIAVGLDGAVQYALEGSVFVGGAVIQWLRDELRLLTESRDAEYYAQKVPDTGGVYLVPAFTGLGAPYWTCTPGAVWWASPGAPGGSTSSGPPRSPSPIRWPTWWRPWRRTPAFPSRLCGPTAGPAGTPSSSSSRPTYWTGPSCAPSSGRPPLWARPAWPDWPWACGKTGRRSAPCGRRTPASPPPSPHPVGRSSSGAGTRQWAAAWTGPSTDSPAPVPVSSFFSCRARSNAVQ